VTLPSRRYQWTLQRRSCARAARFNDPVESRWQPQTVRARRPAWLCPCCRATALVARCFVRRGCRRPDLRRIDASKLQPQTVAVQMPTWCPAATSTTCGSYHGRGACRGCSDRSFAAGAAAEQPWPKAAPAEPTACRTCGNGAPGCGRRRTPTYPGRGVRPRRGDQRCRWTMEVLAAAAEASASVARAAASPLSR